MTTRGLSRRARTWAGIGAGVAAVLFGAAIALVPEMTQKAPAKPVSVLDSRRELEEIEPEQKEIRIKARAVGGCVYGPLNILRKEVAKRDAETTPLWTLETMSGQSRVLAQTALEMTDDGDLGELSLPLSSLPPGKPLGLFLCSAPKGARGCGKSRIVSLAPIGAALRGGQTPPPTFTEPKLYFFQLLFASSGRVSYIRETYAKGSADFGPVYKALDRKLGLEPALRKRLVELHDQVSWPRLSFEKRGPREAFVVDFGIKSTAFCRPPPLRADSRPARVPLPTLRAPLVIPPQGVQVNNGNN